MGGSIRIVAIAVAVLLFLLLALVGGAANSLDSAVATAVASQRSNAPALTHAAVAVTHLGGATATLGLGAVAAALLVLRGESKRAVQLGAIIVSGRLAVDLLKLGFDRPRPAFDLHPVVVHSASFPSGHSANSMISFLAVALFLAPAGHRFHAATTAIGASLAVGSTRVVLSVHWPSDVIAGWLLGFAWVAGYFWLTARLAVPVRPQ